MMDLPTPARPDDPREAAIWDDVFSAGETDLGYYLRRSRQLRDQNMPVNLIAFLAEHPDGPVNVQTNERDFDGGGHEEPECNP